MVGGCEGECMGCSLGDEPLTLMRCQLYEALEWKSHLWSSLQLKGHKGENFFLFLSKYLKLFFCHSFHGMICADSTEIGRGTV